MVDITNDEFRRLSDYIRENYGINLNDEKKSLLTGRLNTILEQNGHTSFTEYFNYVLADQTGQAATSLVNKISTNYTYFMREAEHFNYLRDAVLPFWEERVRDFDLRVWSAGCSTGEEPYTIAFILDEFFKGKRHWDKKILATDISERVLDIAKKGVYDKRQIAALPGKWRLNYFTQEANERYAVTNAIKNEIIFRSFNLITGSFSFKKQFHVIFLRNVTIYFDNQTRMQLFKRIYDVLAPGGYLFLGHSEGIASSEIKFKYIMPAVYRKL